tara:strand:+ start:95 stop:1945 length:1851 start_codon:yes stop_codon:yes gene_type:complete
MITKKYLFIIFFSFFCSNLFSEEAPKKIILLEDNLELENNDVEQSGEKAESEGESNLEEVISTTESKENKSLIVIDDIPKEFNDWYGILASEEGGLGWLMWGSTNSFLAKNLLERTNFSTQSPTLFKLTSKILLSRAQKPKEKKLERIKGVLNGDSELKYLKAKIRILSNIGDTANINKLIDNVPLEIKDDNFYNLIFDLRIYDKDIPYICNELQKKKFDVKQDIEKRKTLIACSIAKRKYSQAQLALDLLENDSVESLDYIKGVRKFLGDPSVKNLLLEEKNIKNMNSRIISLSDYSIAKKIFSKDPLTLDKIIYDMKLYSIEEQIESLEKLVNFGFYSPTILKKSYVDYHKTIKDTVELNNLNNTKSENSLDVRVSLFYLINNTISDVDRAKLLNLLWLKAKEINIEKALYGISLDSINSITPQRELSWFTYPVTRALISNKKLEEAKNWLFFINNDFKDRAVLDLNFCKMLLLLYVVDPDLKKSNLELPDISFLLDVLNNSLEVKKESIYNLMITLKALNYNISPLLWENFYNEFESFDTTFNINKTNLFLILEQSLKKRNLAETVFIVIDLFNSSKKEEINFYYLYKSIYSLNNIGLREYARELGIEINFGL